MPGPVSLRQECCQPSCDEPLNIQIPGPQGDQGDDGQDGDDGVNAFTLTTAQFLMPAELANVNVSVLNTSWMGVGQVLFVVTAGYMQVVSITNSVMVVLKNLEDTASSAYTSNAAPTTAIPTASKVSPGGLQGPAGAAGSGSGTLSGSGAPGVGLGSNGDIYIDVTNRDLYVKIGGAWELWLDIL